MLIWGSVSQSADRARYALVGLVLLVASPAWAKTPQEIFDANAPSIVVVEVHDSAGKLEATGSGVTIAPGEVITNCHVAQEGKTLIVRQDKASYPAQLHYADRDRDLCQLSVPTFKAMAVVLGDMASLKTGARVVAIGAPEGLELSVSEGLISSLRDFGGGSKIIQTTAPISPGSSGGALFDEAGRLIGITTFYLAEGQNLNFALPVNWITQLHTRSAVQSEVQTKTIDWFLGAAQLEQKEDWFSLQTYAQRWTHAEPRNSNALFTLGVAYEKLGQHSEAIVAFRDALRIDPKEEYAWSNLCSTYNSQSQYIQAIDACLKALQLDPKDAYAWYNIGNAYEQLDQYNQAIKSFHGALRIDPKDTDAWNNLGNAYSHLSQNNQSIEAYREALRIDPKKASTWNNLGNAYGKLSQYNQAIDAFHEALRIDPKLVRAWFGLGVTYGIQGDRNGAIDTYQALRTLAPAQADQLFNLVIAPTSTPAPVTMTQRDFTLPDGGNDTDANLLGKARNAERELRLYAPAGDNAIEYYLALRARSPNDTLVNNALQDLFPYLMIAAEQNLKKADVATDLGKAQTYRIEAARIFALLERIDRGAPSLTRLRKMMQKKAGKEMKAINLE